MVPSTTWKNSRGKPIKWWGMFPRRLRLASSARLIFHKAWQQTIKLDSKSRAFPFGCHCETIPTHALNPLKGVGRRSNLNDVRTLLPARISTTQPRLLRHLSVVEGFLAMTLVSLDS